MAAGRPPAVRRHPHLYGASRRDGGPERRRQGRPAVHGATELRHYPSHGRRLRAGAQRAAPTAFPPPRRTPSRPAWSSPTCSATDCRTVCRSATAKWPCGPACPPLRPAPAAGRRAAAAPRCPRPASISPTWTAPAPPTSSTPPSTICWCSATKAATAIRRRCACRCRLSPTDQISFSDIRGNGTTAIVITRVSPGWNTGPATCAPIRRARVRRQAYLLASTDNGLGATTTLRYASSTRFYLADKRAGLPGPRACPSPCGGHGGAQRRCGLQVSFTRRYAYRDGYFDPVARLFRGFGMVESWDAQAYAPFADTPDGNWPTARVDDELRVPPTRIGPGTAWAPMNWLPPWQAQNARAYFHGDRRRRRR